MKYTLFKSLLFFTLFYNYTYADEYLIVANKNMKELSLGEIKAIFLKKISLINDTKVLPINLTPNDIVRNRFEQNILQMSLPRLKAYWTKQHYLGHRPPITMKSQEAIKTFVKKVNGAIGYIDAENMDDSLKIIYRWSN